MPCRQRAVIACPGRGAALLQRCTAEPGPITPTPDSWVPGLQRIIPQTLHAAQRTGHDIAYFRDPAACFARALQILCPRPQSRGRGECRVHAAPAVSYAISVHYGDHEPTG